VRPGHWSDDGRFFALEQFKCGLCVGPLILLRQFHLLHSPTGGADVQGGGCWPGLFGASDFRNVSDLEERSRFDEIEGCFNIIVLLIQECGTEESGAWSTLTNTNRALTHTHHTHTRATFYPTFGEKKNFPFL